jgi:hypothetical protein
MLRYGCYVLVLVVVVTGYATAIPAGLNRIVFQGSGEPIRQLRPNNSAGRLTCSLIGRERNHSAAGSCPGTAYGSGCTADVSYGLITP